MNMSIDSVGNNGEPLYEKKSLFKVKMKHIFSTFNSPTNRMKDYYFFALSLFIITYSITETRL